MDGPPAHVLIRILCGIRGVFDFEAFGDTTRSCRSEFQGAALPEREAVPLERALDGWDSS